jgi:soluble lytic murein transglycosylase-like protein
MAKKAPKRNPDYQSHTERMAEVKRREREKRNQEMALTKFDKRAQYVYNKYKDTIEDAAAKYSIDPWLMAVQITKESYGNPQAKSDAGAMGLSQFMPGTAKDIGLKNPYDPIESIYAQAKYLRRLADMEYIDNDMTLALAAYNAGPGNVQKYSGVPKFKETLNYVDVIPKSLERIRYNQKLTQEMSGIQEEANAALESAQELPDNIFKTQQPSSVDVNKNYAREYESKVPHENSKRRQLNRPNLFQRLLEL